MWERFKRFLSTKDDADIELMSATWEELLGKEEKERIDKMFEDDEN